MTTPSTCGDAGLRHGGKHFGKAARMEHEARRLLLRFGPGAAGLDRIGIAVEGMDDRAGIEQRGGYSRRRRRSRR